MYKELDYLEKVKEIAESFTKANIPYQFTGATSLFIQDVLVEHHNEIHVLIQWDLLQASYDLFQHHTPSKIEKNQVEGYYTFKFDDFLVHITCYFNTTVKTDPYRIQHGIGNCVVWCHSLYAEIYSGDTTFSKEIHNYLKEKQSEMNATNELAWNQENYQALLNRFGLPEVAARKIKDNPEWRLHPFLKYIENPEEKKVIHLLGSNGVKAVALSIIGANVTVVDFSKENKKFAMDVAEYAGESINYIVSDVLSLTGRMSEQFDIVLMELGVLHYFIDLVPLAELVRELLSDDGMFILHEFHPLSTKLITSSGKKHKITGNYFDPSIHSKDVAFTKHMPEHKKEDLAKVFQRHWTLGEIITSFAKAGLYVEVLDEEPNHKLHDMGLPKTFTMIIKKIT
jgi:2-polyprenyl-3-methyl-5-hydroxy-6-metoxy-1,4-benzoquinol methylase